MKMATSMQGLMLIVLLAWLQLAAAQPQDNEASLEGPGGLKVFVGRKGGTIRLYRELPPPPSDNGQQQGGNQKPPKGDKDRKRPPPRSGEIGVSFGRIQEVDSSSNDIGGKHGVQKPGNVDFDVTTEQNRVLQRSGAGLQEIRGDCLDCRSSLRDASDARMTLTVCVVKTNGTMKLSDEDAQVNSGQVKFSVRLDSWSWANDGKYVDVDVIMKVPPGRAVRRKEDSGGRRPVKFELGADATASFSSKVDADGTWKDMEDGYPKFDNKGANNIITLRVPRFSNYAFYDPTIEPGYESGSRAFRASVVAICAALVGFMAFVY